MSNFQIIENESGKYSPEWFYSESQTPEYIALAHKADESRENFINLFGIKQLKSLSGKDLLTSLFITTKEIKPISAICLKWIKVSTCLEEFLAALLISLVYSTIKRRRPGLADPH